LGENEANRVTGGNSTTAPTPPAMKRYAETINYLILTISKRHSMIDKEKAIEHIKSSQIDILLMFAAKNYAVNAMILRRLLFNFLQLTKKEHH